jgi:putative phosphoesterase
MSEIGLISDTHHVLRPEAVSALAGCELIIHAGDVGAPDILDGLAAIAPVRAIRGNIDVGQPLGHLPETLTFDHAGWRYHVLHDLARLAIDPRREGVAVVVYGHSHQPLVDRRDGVLFVNPGSAGPRRFRLPVTVARLAISGPRPEARLIEIAP